MEKHEHKTDPATGSAIDGAPRRVVLVSSSRLFRRVFGRLMMTLRDDLVLDERDSPAALDAVPAGALLVLDAAGRAPAALADEVRACLANAPPARLVVVLDENDDTCCEAALDAGADGVMIKAAPPGVVAEWLDALLRGERVRPAPSVALDPDALPPALRAQLSARRQKLLRLQLGGTSIGETARRLGLTEAKVVEEMRIVMGIVRGRGDEVTR